MDEQEDERAQTSQTVPELPPRRARTSPTTSRIGSTIQEGVTPSTIHEITAKTKPRTARPSSSRFYVSAALTPATVFQDRRECHVNRRAGRSWAETNVAQTRRHCPGSRSRMNETRIDDRAALGS